MTTYFGIDHRFVAAGGVALACGLTAFTTYKTLQLKHSHGHGHGHGHAHGPGVSFGNKKDMFMNFHYATPESVRVFDCIPKDAVDAPTRIVNLCLKHSQGLDQAGVPSRAIDVGCNVGGFVFRLARHFKEVIGFDLNQELIDIANQMKEVGEREYSLELEGEIRETMKACVPGDIDRSRVTFQKADACNPPKDTGNFGCVLTCNVLHHVEHPRKYIQSLQNLVAPGGIFVLVDQFRWNYGDAKKEDWIGGHYKDGKPVMSWPSIQKEMSEHFDLVEDFDTGLISPESRRIYIFMVVKASVWKRKRN